MVLEKSLQLFWGQGIEGQKNESIMQVKKMMALKH